MARDEALVGGASAGTLNAGGGGLAASGGSQLAGGASAASGGMNAVSGMNESGGMNASGGAVGVGGSAAAGGASAVAGASSAGGTLATEGGAGGFAVSSAGGSSAGGAATSAYAPCPAAPEVCRVMPMGYSITLGSGSKDPPGGGYRVPLFHLALVDGKNMTFVGTSGNGPAMVDGVPFPENHNGHSGYIIAPFGSRKGGPPWSTRRWRRTSRTSCC